MIATKLFVGCHVPPELRIQLNTSQAWKQSRVAPNPEQDPADILHDGYSYLGYFLEGTELPLSEIRALAPRIHAALRNYCPTYNDDEQIYVFPQLFVS